MTIAELDEKIKNGGLYILVNMCDLGGCERHRLYYPIIGFEQEDNGKKLVPKFNNYTDKFNKFFIPMEFEKKKSCTKMLGLIETCIYDINTKYAISIDPNEKEVEVDDKEGDPYKSYTTKRVGKEIIKVKINIPNKIVPDNQQNN